MCVEITKITHVRRTQNWHSINEIPSELYQWLVLKILCIAFRVSVFFLFLKPHIQNTSHCCCIPALCFGSVCLPQTKIHWMFREIAPGFAWNGINAAVLLHKMDTSRINTKNILPIFWLFCFQMSHCCGIVSWNVNTSITNHFRMSLTFLSSWDL